MKKIYTGILVLACTFIAQYSIAAIEVYMRAYDNSNVLIPGESVNQSFSGWIELNSIAEGSEATIISGPGGGTSRPSLNPLKFQMPVNSASIPLLTALYKGQRLRYVDIWFVKSSANPQGCNSCAFYKIHLEDVLVSSLTGASEDETVSQQLSFEPLKIAWAYYKQANTGSYPSTPTNKFGWDYNFNREFTFSF